MAEIQDKKKLFEQYVANRTEILEKEKNYFNSINCNSEGGEGRIYVMKNDIIKIFDKQAVDTNLKGKKIVALMRLGLALPKNHRFALPYKLVVEFDKKLNKVEPIGFRMKKIEGKEFAILNGKKACKDYGVSLKKILEMLLVIKYDLHVLHKFGIIVGDLNERNILFETNKNLTPHIIDCDSWSIKVDGNHYPCQVIMPSYQDPLMKFENKKAIFTRETDNFSFMLMAFKMLTRMSPFAGTHPAYPNLTPEERIKIGAHIIGVKGAGLPKNIRNFNIISTDLLKLFKSFFEGKTRYFSNEFEEFYGNLKQCNKCGEQFWRGRGDCPCCGSSNTEDIETFFDANKIYNNLKIVEENVKVEKVESEAEVKKRMENLELVETEKEDDIKRLLVNGKYLTIDNKVYNRKNLIFDLNKLNNEKINKLLEEPENIKNIIINNAKLDEKSVIVYIEFKDDCHIFKGDKSYIVPLWTNFENNYKSRISEYRNNSIILVDNKFAVMEYETTNLGNKTKFIFKGKITDYLHSFNVNGDIVKLLIYDASKKYLLNIININSTDKIKSVEVKPSIKFDNVVAEYDNNTNFTAILFENTSNIIGLLDKSNLKVYANDSLVIDSDKHINDFKEPIKRFYLVNQYLYFSMKNKIKILKLKQNRVEEKDIKVENLTSEDIVYPENRKFERYTDKSSSILIIKEKEN